ncbi:MAG: hypothetical protein ACP5RF_01345 [Candidatus Micrarchaeia archaeon]
MISEILFALISLFTLASAIVMLLSRKLLRAVIALAFAFTGSSLIFLMLQQSILALLQLFVFVGGLSTYLIVAVAAEPKLSKNMNARNFAAAATALLIAFFFIVYKFAYANTTTSTYSGSFVTSAGIAIGHYYALLGIIIFLPFASAIGSILLIKRLTKVVV